MTHPDLNDLLRSCGLTDACTYVCWPLYCPRVACRPTEDV